MWVYVLTASVFLLAVVGMAVGVIVSGKRLKGSCGGIMASDGRVIGDCLCARKGTKACDKVTPSAS